VTEGIPLLIAWAEFAILLIVLARLLSRPRR
jgi:hypothetical protein